jgi:adenylate cyclase
LRARYVLEGSVRKSGGRVRVTAQPDRGWYRSSPERGEVRRDLEDLFDVQDEIVKAIVGAIEPELLKFERNRIADQPQHNEDAYELYQRGMWHHTGTARKTTSRRRTYSGAPSPPMRNIRRRRLRWRSRS